MIAVLAVVSAVVALGILVKAATDLVDGADAVSVLIRTTAAMILTELSLWLQNVSVRYIGAGVVFVLAGVLAVVWVVRQDTGRVPVPGDSRD